ncbi:NADH-quinone oxidoreductase subunit A [Sulfuracidifex metallicus]|uniref:NADH-quinone oxidoreductase subunit A n=1 Tax=Sulfuracidifex metallicus TaxID=47303 RepID=UPI0022724D92|nr:NADH-quinone oxidoreductase subunit A [Sulfuracidifex metallicus]MCY0850608.1 NADH-quinone oxidoreductase subunit A [Sulfuracidifex metallicus]
MALTQAFLAFGLPIIIFLGAGLGGYKIISLIVPSKPNPVKLSRFEAGNIPTGEGRLWFPLQYYGYLLVYTTLEPLIVFLFLVASASYSGNLILFRNLVAVVGTFIVVLYPILNYAIKQINIVLNWELRR